MSFDSALSFTLSQEGQWYDGTNPSDPNPTYKGITQRRYDAYRAAAGLPFQSVELIADSELQAIYFQYWTDAHCSAVGMLAGVVLFDIAVNEGAGTAVKLLQGALGVTADGVIGPLTTAAISATNDAALAGRLLWARLNAYHKIALANPVERPNLTTWLGRTLACKAALNL